MNIAKPSFELSSVNYTFQDDKTHVVRQDGCNVCTMYIICVFMYVCVYMCVFTAIGH